MQACSQFHDTKQDFSDGIRDKRTLADAWGQHREKQDIAAQPGYGFKSIHNTDIQKGSGGACLGCLFFCYCTRIQLHLIGCSLSFIYEESEKQHAAKICKKQREKQSGCRVSAFQAGLPQISKQKGRTWIAAECKKIFSFLSADLSCICKVSGQFGAYREAQQLSKKKGIHSPGRQPEKDVTQADTKAWDLYRELYMQQQSCKDQKRQQCRKQGVKPQGKAVFCSEKGRPWICKQEEKQEAGSCKKQFFLQTLTPFSFNIWGTGNDHS